MIRIYIIGLAILVIAILANSIIVKLGINSWYDFIEQLTNSNVSNLKRATFIDYLWLFMGYPLVLGFGYWIGDKVYHVLFG